MEDFDLSKSFDDLLKPKEAALSTTTEVPDITSLGLILPHLPPEGQAWLNGLNAYCRRAVEHDLRTRCASHSRQLSTFSALRNATTCPVLSTAGSHFKAACGHSYKLPS